MSSSRRLSFILALALLTLCLSAMPALADGLAPVIDEHFDAIDGSVWGITHANQDSRAYSPTYGSAVAANSELTLRPNQLRGGDVLWTRSPVVTRLPAHVTARIRLPQRQYRSVQLFLMPRAAVNAAGTAWLGTAAPAIHLTAGTSQYASYPSLYVYPLGATRVGSRWPVATILPVDTWIDIELWIDETGVTSRCNGLQMTASCDMRAQLDATNGLVLTMLQTSDAGATGVEVDRMLVMQQPDVQNIPPVAQAGPDATAYVGESTTFDGSLSTDADGSIAQWAWDFGDGSSSQGAQASHAYASPGVYEAVLTVTDDAGASATDTTRVTVLSALDGLQQLRASVSAAPLTNPSSKATKGYKAALLKKLDRAAQAWNDGDLAAMNEALDAFADQLNAAQVPAELIVQWTGDIEQIKAAAACALPPQAAASRYSARKR